MTAWTPHQLQELSTSDEIRIAPLRIDGQPMSPRIIWVVTSSVTGAEGAPKAGNARVFVRSTNGPTAGWYRNAVRSMRGRLATRAGEILVAFSPVDEHELDLVDDAYRTKYGRRYGSIVEHLRSDGPRGATLEVDPVAES